jgi:hypothetical protein
LLVFFAYLMRLEGGETREERGERREEREERREERGERREERGELAVDSRKWVKAEAS